MDVNEAKRIVGTSEMFGEFTQLRWSEETITLKGKLRQNIGLAGKQKCPYWPVFKSDRSCINWFSGNSPVNWLVCKLQQLDFSKTKTTRKTLKNTCFGTKMRCYEQFSLPPSKLYLA